jgi:hypothetical protein
MRKNNENKIDEIEVIWPLPSLEEITTARLHHVPGAKKYTDHKAIIFELRLVRKKSIIIDQ